MTSNDINIALSYLDEGLLEEHFIYKERLKIRARAIKSIVRFAPIAACICIVFAATALLLPKLAREPAPPTPEGQIQMGGVDGYNSTQSDNTTEETTNNNGISTGFENGFTFDYSDESNPISCAYKSDKNVFDIDDVSLDFYFGAIYTNPDGIILNLNSYPAFELYFSTYDEKILIKRVEEELISDKYKRVYEISEDFRTITYDYVYSERFTIPKEIFTSDNGILWFTINAAEDSTDPADFRSIAGIWLYYKKIDNTILLSSDGNFEIVDNKKLDTSNNVSIIHFDNN